MAIVFINQGQNSAAGDITAWVPPWLPAAGECVVLTLANRLATTATGVSGFGATWVNVLQNDGATVHVATWVGYNCNGSTTSMTTTGSGAGNCAYELTGYSGVQTSPSPVDQSGGNFGSSTAPSTATITPGVAGEVVVACIGADQSETFSSPTGGFTALTKSTSSGPDNQSGYLIQTSAAAATMAYTIAPTTSWATVIISLKPAAAAGGGAFIPGNIQRLKNPNNIH